ncbi:MAG TPA: winged helix-turn-helix domain-containing protein [Candidatus Limnocylindria bacterium]|nr:winged helix-turn-helix domain-containing protein [Candidatus Limnocylindria bacterium]
MSSVPEPPFVLLADDDPSALTELRTALRLAGAQTAGARSVKVALDALVFHAPTLVVVQIAMENGKGWEVVHAARSQGQLPTIVIERSPDPGTRRAAFAAGADDVIALPLDATELATRIMALTGRVRRAVTSGPVYRHRGLVLDVSAHTVHLHGRAIDLTAQQFAILRTLFEANGATLDRPRLLARIESLDDEPPSERAIDLHVTRLRRRLGDSAKEPRYIEAVYGVGYRLATSEAGVNALGDDAEDVLCALPDPLLVVDRLLRIRFVNDAATRFLARGRSEIVGQRCGDVLECQDCRGLDLDGPRCFALAISGGASTLRDVPASVLADGAREDVRFTIARVQGDELLSIEIRPPALETRPA